MQRQCRARSVVVFVLGQAYRRIDLPFQNSWPRIELGSSMPDADGRGTCSIYLMGGLKVMMIIVRTALEGHQTSPTVKQ